MKTLFFSFVLICASYAAYAEVKAPGTAVPFACGSNELPRTVPGVTDVCQVTIAGTDKTGLSVRINKGALSVSYFYEYKKPAGLRAECGRHGFDITCIHHARLSGIVGAKSLVDFAPAQTLPSDEIVVYTTQSRKGTSLSAEFLKMKFESSSLNAVMSTQGI